MSCEQKYICLKMLKYTDYFFYVPLQRICEAYDKNNSEAT